MNKLIVILIVVLGLWLIPNVVQQKSASAQSSSSSKSWIEAVLEAKKSVVDRVEKDQIPLDSLNIDNEMWQLQNEFPGEMSAVTPYIRSDWKKFLSTMDGSFEKEIIARVSSNFKNVSWVNSGISNLKTATSYFRKS